MTNYSIKRFNPYSKEELISALKKIAGELGTGYVSGQTFQKYTGISESTIQRRFGTWKIFCEMAGLNPIYNRTNNKDELFQNLDKVWRELGRQPRAKEMRQPLSAISNSRYLKIFGNWYETCVQFLAWKSGVSAEEIDKESKRHLADICKEKKHKTARAISLSLRYEVLKRDSFKCTKCGRSPANNTGVELHIDHIVPYSKGGETELSNLQTNCSECNLGKGNRHTG